MDYDVCLSFAGADRDFVRAVAAELRLRAVRVCYDEYEKATLWGKDLYTHLDEVYQRRARYGPEVLGSDDGVTVSLALRAAAYGADLIDPRLGGYVRTAARAAEDQSGTAGS